MAIKHRTNSLQGHFMKKQLAAYGFLLPAMLAFIITKYYPIILGIVLSFFKINIVNFPGKFIGATNYARVFQDEMFYLSLKNTIKFYVMGVLFTFWPPIIVAILVNEARRMKTLMRLLYYIPGIVPVIATSIFWSYVWNPDYGLANYIIGLIGMAPKMWLNDPNLVYWCLVLPGMFFTGGMGMLIYLAGLQGIPEEQYEAALVDGAGFFTRIRFITIPFIMPTVKMMFMLSIINSLNAYQQQLLMTGGGPLNSTMTVILYAYQMGTKFSEYSYTMALSFVVAAAVFILTLVKMKLEGREK